MNLTEVVYHLTRSYPKEELYGLTSQTRRCAVFIPANIAEGKGRRSKKEFQQFLGHSRGSLLEFDTHLELALRFDYISSERYQNVLLQINEVGRIINGLMRSLG